jgi:hypothetical protein
VKANGGWRAAAMLTTSTPRCAAQSTAKATRCFGSDCRWRKFRNYKTFLRAGFFSAQEQAATSRVFSSTHFEEAMMGRGILLWLLGVPIPVIILLWLFFGR